MLVRITSLILRFCALLALLLGILFWIGIVVPTGALLGLHMLVGILVILSLWILSIVHFKRRPGLAISAFLLGLIAFIFGVNQENLFVLAPSLIWLIKITHLFLVLSAIALSGPLLAGGSGPVARKPPFPRGWISFREHTSIGPTRVRRQADKEDTLIV